MNKLDIQRKPGIITEIIKSWESSRFYKEMITSDKYYEGQTDITKRERMVEVYDDETKSSYLIPNSNASNHKIAHKYHYELVNQAKDYICGRPIKISYNTNTISQNIISRIENILKRDNAWTVFGQENVKNAQKYKWSWSRVFIDSARRFRFEVVDPKNCIALWDKEENLKLMIRYYTKSLMDSNGEIKNRTFCEVYDDKSKDVYTTDDSRRFGVAYGTFTPLLLNFSLLKQEIHYKKGKKKRIRSVNRGFGRVPFFQWKFNNDDSDSLMPIKCFIDIIDRNVSDLANNVEDIQEAIWVLENYTGQSLSEFMRDLKVHKALNVGQDGDARPEFIKIPIEARKLLYEIANANIYKFGRGIDFTDRTNRGNQSGVGLKWSYGALDQKVDELEANGRVALRSLFYFLAQYLKTKGEIKNDDWGESDINFIFNRSIMVNQEEQSQMAIAAPSLISKRTAIENHPFVWDVEEELRRLADESG